MENCKNLLSLGTLCFTCDKIILMFPFKKRKKIISVLSFMSYLYATKFEPYSFIASSHTFIHCSIKYIDTFLKYDKYIFLNSPDMSICHKYSI